MAQRGHHNPWRRKRPPQEWTLSKLKDLVKNSGLLPCLSLSLVAAIASSGCIGEATDEFVQEDELTDEASQEIKGPNTVATDYPEAAVITMKRNGGVVGGCSGSVIAPRVVLTAGHCVISFSEWDVKAPHANNQTASSVKGIRYDYTDLSGAGNYGQRDIGLVFLNKDIVLNSYPIIAKTSTTSNVIRIGRVNNGVVSSTSLFASPPLPVQESSGIPFYYIYRSESLVIEQGDSGGPDVLPGPAPHTIVAVNSRLGAVDELLARVDQLESWIQERIAAKSCGPACSNPIDQPAFFVRQMYLDVLGREPDSGGATFYSNTLNGCNGNSACLASTRVSIARGMLESSESRAQYWELEPASPDYKTAYIKHCYMHFLNRLPSAAESTWWVNTLSSTGDYNAVVNGFITSAEFRQRFGPA
jgi:hypothetical protein